MIEIVAVSKTTSNMSSYLFLSTSQVEDSYINKRLNLI